MLRFTKRTQACAGEMEFASR